MPQRRAPAAPPWRRKGPDANPGVCPPLPLSLSGRPKLGQGHRGLAGIAAVIRMDPSCDLFKSQSEPRLGKAIPSDFGATAIRAELNGADMAHVLQRSTA